MELLPLKKYPFIFLHSKIILTSFLDGDKSLIATEGVIITESEANSVLSGMFSEEDLLRDNHQTVIILQGDLPNLNLENATEQLLSEIHAGENRIGTVNNNSNALINTHKYL